MDVQDLLSHFVQSWQSQLTLALVTAKTEADAVLTNHFLSPDFYAPMTPEAINSAADERALQAAQKLMGSMIRVAEKFFPPNGVPMTVDLKAIPEQFLPSLRRVREFDPAAVWAFLLTTYSPDNARTKAFTDCAGRMVRSFNLNSAAPKQRGGNLILCVEITLDSNAKKYNGKSQPCHSSQTSLGDAFNALKGFGEFLGRDDLLVNLDIQGRHWNGIAPRIESRAAITLSTGVTLVTYQNKFEFVFAPAEAQQLQVFISTYAADAFSKAN